MLKTPDKTKNVSFRHRVELGFPQPLNMLKYVNVFGINSWSAAAGVLAQAALEKRPSWPESWARRLRRIRLGLQNTTKL